MSFNCCDSPITIGYTIFPGKTACPSLVLESDRLIGVFVPDYWSVEETVNWLRQRYTQILQRQYKKESAAKPIDQRYRDGEVFYYLGRAYRLAIREGVLTCIRRVCGVLTITLPDTHPDKVARQLRLWHRQRAKRVLLRLYDQYVRRLQTTSVQRPACRLSARLQDWGSCASGRVIVLNPGLVQ